MILGKSRNHSFGWLQLSTQDIARFWIKNIYVEVSRNAYMKLDEIKKLNHPILDLNNVFCVQGD